MGMTKLIYRGPFVQLCNWSVLIFPVLFRFRYSFTPIGLFFLCGILMAFARAIQCPSASHKPESSTNGSCPTTNLCSFWSRSGFQDQLLRNARFGAASSPSRDESIGIGCRPGSFSFDHSFGLALIFLQNFQHEIRFQLELANEHREFISGKKNGKINKIMQTTNVKIKFETFNEFNFLIDLAGQDRMAIQGLTLLQEELPAEISFHVPESYHKRIIGVGGKSIQRIMKRFGVYVKFSNAEEFAALGGYLDNEDNVVARTPAKNAINLENLKQAVMELVNPKVCFCSVILVR